MPQPDNTPSVSLPTAWPAPYASQDGGVTLVPLRGPSGKLYGEFDPSTGILIFRRGKLPAEHIDLTPYFRATEKREA